MGYLDKIVSLYHFDNDATDAIGPNDGGEGNAAYTIDAAIGSHAFAGDAVDKRINIGQDSSLNITTAISIGCLIKPNSSFGYATKSIVHRVDAYFLSLGWGTPNEYGFAIRDGAGWHTALAAGIALDTANYHAIIGTFDGSNVKIFVDKVLRGITAYSGSIASNPSSDVIVHALGGEAAGFLDTKTDELFIANDYLTDGGTTIVGNTATGEVAEVTDLLLAGTPLDGIATIAILRRRMEDY